VHYSDAARKSRTINPQEAVSCPTGAGVDTQRTFAHYVKHGQLAFDSSGTSDISTASPVDTRPPGPLQCSNASESFLFNTKPRN